MATTLFPKFYHGTLANYTANKSTYDTDGTIYFVDDKPLIYAFGHAHGVSQELLAELEGVKSLAYNTENHKLVVTSFDGITKDVTLPEVSASASGLMTSDLLAKLNTVYAAIGEDGTVAEQIEEAKEEIIGDAETYTDLGKVEEKLDEIDSAIDAMDLTAVTGIVTSVSQEDGKVSASAVQAGDGLDLGTTLKVKIAEANKVLAATADGITATLTFVDNTATSKIELQGIGGVKVAEFDYAKFIVDGMLDDADINESNELVLTMNTAAGSKELKVDLTRYIDVYTQGNGITISDKVITAKAKEGDKYVEVTTDGIASKGIDNAISTAVGTAKAELEDRIEDLEEALGSGSIEDQIAEAIEALDVANIGGTGKYIQVVGQADGKVTATAQDLTASAVAITAIDGLTTTSNDVQAALKALLDMWQWHEA